MPEVLTFSKLNHHYATSPFIYKRFDTHTVSVGDLKIGGGAPISIQSMTTTPTLNTKATVSQTISLFDAGADLVRITTPGPKDAANLGIIKAELLKRGYTKPIVADIHFSPKAAMISLEHVEKVRINHGNYVDSKRFVKHEYSDAEYEDELERLRDSFRPLVLRAKELGRALRVGTNHGSLSDRILNRYGDTPLGMVESALEFLRLADELDYHDIVVSMKSSNVQIMVYVYRLLVKHFLKEGFSFPLHLGVTEAGSGIDGRLKSAIGIGSLLNEGIGDTIRVSLTEDPITEIVAAREIINTINEYKTIYPKEHRKSFSSLVQDYHKKIGIYNYKRQSSIKQTIGQIQIGDKKPLFTCCYIPDYFNLLSIEEKKNQIQNYQERGGNSLIYSSGNNHDNANSAEIIDYAQNLGIACIANIPSLSDGISYLLGGDALFISLTPTDIQKDKITSTNQFFQKIQKKLREGNKTMILNYILPVISSEIETIETIETPDTLYHFQLKQLNDFLIQKETYLKQSNVILSFQLATQSRKDRRSALPSLLLIQRLWVSMNCVAWIPVLLQAHYQNLSQAQNHASISIANLLVDGIGAGLAIHINELGLLENLQFQLDLLQSTQLRLSKTEYISCPSCGRTLFDLEETTIRIQKRTKHLKGLKIAIMGCIVNGPGEMADADFGYIGAGPGKVHLYREKNIVKANVPSQQADSELVKLIQESGCWVEPLDPST